MTVDLTASVHAAITLLTTTQDITTSITTPNTARALSVTGTKAGATLTGTVTLTGTDDFGQACTETYTLNGNATANGTGGQVFATVTNIACPVRVTAADTVKVGYQDALFDLTEARAFQGSRLSSTTDYTDAQILAKEQEIRQWLEEVCGVAFVPKLCKEYIDGTGGQDIYVTHAQPLVVTAAVIYDSEGTASETFDATDIADLAYYEDEDRIRRKTEGTWTTGDHNVLITYLHGFRAVPELIKRAALQILVTELPTTNVSLAADSYDEGGMSVSFGRGDGYNGNWHRIPDVQKAIRMYSRGRLGIA